MYSLLSGLWTYAFQKDEFFILILGLDNAGKTTYLEQTKTEFCPNYKMLNPNKITSTVGLNIGQIDTAGVRLNFWDLGGQQELQALWDKYFAECHGIVYVVDSSDHERLHESWRAFHGLLESEHLEGLPLMLLCNKQDVDSCATVSDIKTVFHESVARLGKRDCTVMPVSALRGTNVADSIDWLVGRVKKNCVRRPPSRQT